LKSSSYKESHNCYGDAIERKGRAKVLCSYTYVDPFHSIYFRTYNYGSHL